MSIDSSAALDVHASSNRNLLWLASAPVNVDLHGDDAHIWLVPIYRFRDAAPSLEQLLSPDEIDRVRRFKFPHLKCRYTVAHGVLRSIIGRYLNVEPQSLIFGKNTFGKPFLIDYDWLRFNLSHSNDVALIVVARDREVGVDIEYIREDIDVLELANDVFSEDERSALRSGPLHQQRRAFFTCWTRKEAYLKATGRGLAIPPKTFDVSVVAEQPAALLGFPCEPAECGRWLFHDVRVHRDYAATVVIQAR